jgi:hypothetical protein
MATNQFKVACTVTSTVTQAVGIPLQTQNVLNSAVSAKPIFATNGLFYNIMSTTTLASGVMSIVWVVDVLCNVILLVRGYGVGIMWL